MTGNPKPYIVVSIIFSISPIESHYNANITPILFLGGAQVCGLDTKAGFVSIREFPYTGEVPGPAKYVEQWPFGLLFFFFLRGVCVLSSHYFSGLGRRRGRGQ